MSKVANIGKLAGHTLFISGASRGIGLEIAKKAAADGANIVVAAKTATAHPKLPGTIYTAADEIEKVGGKALPLVVDIRDEKNVEDAVAAAVKEFGGIDICINNASAISLTGTLDTPMKRYDLMHSINGRGTYLVSQKCLPHLLDSKEAGRNPHILNNSPPLDMRPIWFQGHVAYTMAKYNMSLCALGMAAEFQDKVAVNCMWPKTAIWTAAMEMLGGDDSAGKSRTPQIMADTAYSILCQPTSFSGNFIIDDEYLEKHHNIKDFSMPGLAGKGKGVCRMEIKDVVTMDLDLLNGKFSTEQDGVVKPMATLSCDEANFLKMAAGALDPTKAFMTGKLKIKGDMTMAMRLQHIFKQLSEDLKAKEAPAADSGASDGSYGYGDLDKVISKIGSSLEKNKGKQKGIAVLDFGEPAVQMDLTNGTMKVAKSKDDFTDKPTATMSIKSSDFILLATGKMDGMKAFMTGKLKVKGDMSLVMKLQKYF
jgi:NAD(P)-dependent dehydrogenase (short-subunit alcohol dehydrogenase family)/putative sterol carrier protein